MTGKAFTFGQGKLRQARKRSCAVPALLAIAFLFAALPAWAGTEEIPAPPLPDAPQPQQRTTPKSTPCSAAQSGAPPFPCPPQPPKNWFQRFLTGPEVKPMTPKEKARLAARNVMDPFNALTILGLSAITVGSDAHSPYGPGMKGLSRNVGVSYAQDVTGEFFGTFLISSIDHQDPHYHRMPKASIPRRIEHAIVQVVWTQGDNGKEMVNYAAIVGFAIDAEIGDLYVPGQQRNLPSTAERYVTNLASAPIENFITEFLPDVARHIHIHVVLLQRIINQVARTETAAGQ